MEGCEASFDADFAIDVADAGCDDFDVEPEGLYDDDGMDEEEAEDEEEVDYERPRRPERGRAKGRRPKRPSVRKKMRKGNIEGARNCAGHACRTNIAAVLVTTCSAILMCIFLTFYIDYKLY
ncbi:hypothetical protein SKAU_G00118810 [Synaphobranchus kaupii]|uniref:Uncharacterized protein n=1 Tax=Synaphobranchus kaupii TaxID=118154 RepID=A0A9Q1J2A6_SYNKA|nr:hypothetical protein SKAU_G00118810 [Synaphobranchus kaupii]